MTQTLKTGTSLIRAAGGLLWRSGPSGREIAIVHRERYDDWTLPKGKLDPGESWEQAALREVWEETGCRAEITGFAGAVAYQTEKGAKVVRFWNMRVLKDDGSPSDGEVDRVVWLSPQVALTKLQYPLEYALLEVWKEIGA